MSQKLTVKKLKKYGIPEVLWPGLIAASVVGVLNLQKIKDYFDKDYHPKTEYVQKVDDGDSFILKNGQNIRLVGVNAPERGKAGFKEASEYLSKELTNKKVYLEYDRYLDDRDKRILAWVWIDCESDTPQFLPADYMHKNQSNSMPGLIDNPEGCKNGKLVNEELIKNGFAEIEVYDKRGELKYQSRLEKLHNTLPN